ncbi:MAG TPA: protein-disulfide reductase DsbD family protein [Bacteroidales bacterium]|nr:protein-disulfide reductase DsbD family protein [Bacteroidales bacterium]
MKRCVFFLIIVFAYLISFSQENIVEWKTSVSRIDDGSYNLVINADIDSDWYIYGMNIGEGGPLPLEFSIEDSENKVFTFSFSEISVADKMFDDVFGMDVMSYTHKADFKCNFMLKKDITKLNVIIEGQACNKKNGMCIQISENISCEIFE